MPLSALIGEEALGEKKGTSGLEEAVERNEPGGGLESGRSKLPPLSYVRMISIEGDLPIALLSLEGGEPRKEEDGWGKKKNARQGSQCSHGTKSEDVSIWERLGYLQGVGRKNWIDQ